eukprot:643157-Hanusia_phi.AAC.3
MLCNHLLLLLLLLLHVIHNASVVIESNLLGRLQQKSPFLATSPASSTLGPRRLKPSCPALRGSASAIRKVHRTSARQSRTERNGDRLSQNALELNDLSLYDVRERSSSQVALDPTDRRCREGEIARDKVFPIYVMQCEKLD